MDTPPEPRPTPRALARERTMRRIVELGNAQLVARGPEQLSLREIARGLGMVSSAVYRYVASRDELLTLLLVDAFDDLADAVDAALADAPASGAAQRFSHLAHAMRTWALAHPARWALLYGTPVRDYAAPGDRTTGPGTRVIAHLLQIVADADTGADPAADGSAPLPAAPELGPRLTEVLQQGARDLGSPAPVQAVLRTTVLWSALVGSINGELSEQFGADATPVAEELFGAHVAVLQTVLVRPSAVPAEEGPTGH